MAVVTQSEYERIIQKGIARSSGSSSDQITQSDISKVNQYRLENKLQPYYFSNTKGWIAKEPSGTIRFQPSGQTQQATQYVQTYTAPQTKKEVTASTLLKELRSVPLEQQREYVLSRSPQAREVERNVNDSLISVSGRSLKQESLLKSQFGEYQESKYKFNISPSTTTVKEFKTTESVVPLSLESAATGTRLRYTSGSSQLISKREKESSIVTPSGKLIQFGTVQQQPKIYFGSVAGISNEIKERGLSEQAQKDIQFYAKGQEKISKGYEKAFEYTGLKAQPENKISLSKEGIFLGGFEELKAYTRTAYGYTAAPIQIGLSGLIISRAVYDNPKYAFSKIPEALKKTPSTLKENFNYKTAEGRGNIIFTALGGYSTYKYLSTPKGIETAPSVSIKSKTTTKGTVEGGFPKALGQKTTTIVQYTTKTPLGTKVPTKITIYPSGKQAITQQIGGKTIRTLYSPLEKTNFLSQFTKKNAIVETYKGGKLISSKKTYIEPPKNLDIKFLEQKQISKPIQLEKRIQENIVKQQYRKTSTSGIIGKQGSKIIKGDVVIQNKATALTKSFPKERILLEKQVGKPVLKEYTATPSRVEIVDFAKRELKLETKLLNKETAGRFNLKYEASSGIPSKTIFEYKQTASGTFKFQNPEISKLRIESNKPSIFNLKSYGKKATILQQTYETVQVPKLQSTLRQPTSISFGLPTTQSAIGGISLFQIPKSNLQPKQNQPYFIESIPIQKTNLEIKETPKYDSEIKPISETKFSSETKYISTVKPRLKSSVKQAPILKQTSVQIPSVISTGVTRPSPINTGFKLKIPKIQPPVRIGVLPPIFFGKPSSKSTTTNFITRGKQAKAYKPSLYSVGFEIRGKSTKIGILSGLGIRPITKEIKKKRSF